MTKGYDSNFIDQYESALADLKLDPGNLDAQHKAVLALARIGSLDFAQQEYKRYGLDTVRHHEDIMALGGRLSKDMYLASTGKVALEHARDAAEQYEAAFVDTGGYYSGINAATMALLANMPAEIVQARARNIANQLPEAGNVSKTEHYFIEATRAESFLLQGDMVKAAECLKSATQFDPLNYTAHAATLKQFALILNAHGAGMYWLDAFKPPSPAHFAGHIWQDSERELYENELKVQLSDSLQAHDIAYGYGALAAGADILLAETLLEEGAELHVLLPCSPDQFIQTSVTPFGPGWQARFDACLKAAQSVTIWDDGTSWPNASLNRINGRIAMGQAMMKAAQFEVDAKQLLIWDRNSRNTFTENHNQDWPLGDAKQIIIPFQKTKTDSAKTASEFVSPICEMVVLGKDPQDIKFNTEFDAIKWAETALSEDKAQHIILKTGLPKTDIQTLTKDFMSLPNGIYMSESMAALLTWQYIDHWQIYYAGRLTLPQSQGPRIFRLELTG